MQQLSLWVYASVYSKLAVDGKLQAALAQLP